MVDARRWRRSSSRLFVLRTAEGRLATFDRALGPELTDNVLLAYAWSSLAEAEGQRRIYEQALQVPLHAAELTRRGMSNS